MNRGFQERSVDVRTQNGRDDIFLTAAHYLDRNGVLHEIPIGSTTDGISAPGAFQNIIPACGENDWLPGALHDAGYRNFLRVQVSGVWVLANYTQIQCDNLLLDAMESCGVGFFKRHTIYRALRMFGASDFKKDREQHLTLAMVIADSQPKPKTP